MTYKEIQDLVKMVVRLELAELKIRDGDFELSVRTKEYTKARSSPAVAAPVISPAVAPTPASDAASEATAGGDSGSREEVVSDLVEIKSPIVGTFYRSPSPDKPPFIKVGDIVNTGDVVCIVEAMKLFNEIESEVSGKVVKVIIEDASPVEYDQPLFLIDPKG